MNKLYIIRHSKSSWKDLSLDDFDRPLNSRGKKDSRFMGKLLKKRGAKPSLIISSPAVRAMKSAINISKEIGYDIEKISLNTDMYEASVDELLKTISLIDNKYKSIFLIAHNPSINMLVDYLYSKNTIFNVVTSGVVEFELNCLWSEIKRDCAKFISFEYPKKYI